MMARLTEPSYLAFPFRINRGSVEGCGRSAHVRDLIEQVLFTGPTERIYRPGFGAGLRALVFEANVPALAEVISQRLMASLAEALRGEVDPRTLRVEFGTDPDSGGETLLIAVSYTLATLGREHREEFRLGSRASSAIAPVGASDG